MATGTDSEVQLFYHFLGQRLESGEPTLSVEEAVAAFQEYRRDVAKFQDDIQPALDQVENGETREIDFDAFKAARRANLDRGESN